MNRVLLVDDDSELCELLDDYLTQHDFVLHAVHDGERGLTEALSGDYDLIILDVMLPAMSGTDALRKLRKKSPVPVLMLTARGDDIDRIIGLELGADDYLPKPFNPRELLARIRAILRRAEPYDRPDLFRIDELTVDPAAREVHQGEDTVELTSTEFSILHLLVADAGKVVDKDTVSRKALGRPLGRYDRSIDMHVSNIRRKLGPSPHGGERIKTVRGVGYLYVLTDSNSGER